MLPEFLIEETTVRESGESPVFDAAHHATGDLLVTLGITHAVEQESIGIDILTSKDGATWHSTPVVSFTPKSYCGTYRVVVPTSGSRYIKAVWKPQRWSKADSKPFFRMYLHAEPYREAVAQAAGAA
jgi:hypothetical protein